MGAETPARRQRTARELAEAMGASTRTVRRIVAEPRDEFLARANRRRAQAVELRSQGMKYREIADEMGVSIGTVSSLIHGDAKEQQRHRDAPDAPDAHHDAHHGRG